MLSGSTIPEHSTFAPEDVKETMTNDNENYTEVNGRTRGFFYGCLVGGYAWLIFDGWFSFVLKALHDIGLSAKAALIFALYIVVGIGALLALSGISGKPVKSLIGKKIREILSNSLIVCITIVAWFFVFDVFEIGIWLNLVAAFIGIPVSLMLIIRFGYKDNEDT